jgi:uncharacterized protein YacL
MKKIYSPGDTLTIHLTQSGRKESQGIGYLNDSTMILVQDGGKYINETIQVEVNRTLETSRQYTMIFARLSRLPFEQYKRTGL